jgi:hypothetical protein
MPFRPECKIRLGDRIEIEVVQPDGGRALVVGILDKVPVAAGGLALQIVVCDAQVRALPSAGGV